MSITYAVLALIAVALLLGYCTLIRKKEIWLLCLFVCVVVVNTGYYLLSISDSLLFALLSNDLIYLGSVFLSLCMLLTIVKLCGFTPSKKLILMLTLISVMMFGIVATSGVLPWYYREISLVFVDGAAKLEKVYGVLHPVYLAYLAGYFTAMVVCVVRSIRCGMMASQKHAALLAAIVFGNISVWMVEKFVPWDFEFLSVSYLFSEVVLLGLCWMMEDYVRADSLVREDKMAMLTARLPEGVTLHPREREILMAILENKKRRDIALELNLSENTIKTYTRNLYKKLGVTSREELYQLV